MSIADDIRVKQTYDPEGENDGYKFEVIEEVVEEKPDHGWVGPFVMSEYFAVTPPVSAELKERAVGKVAALAAQYAGKVDKEALQQFTMDHWDDPSEPGDIEEPLTLRHFIEAFAKLSGLKPEDVDLSDLDTPVTGYIPQRGEMRDPNDKKRAPNPLSPPMVETDDPALTYQRGGSFPVDGSRLMGAINVHGTVTGRWPGKGTLKTNKPRGDVS